MKRKLVFILAVVLALSLACPAFAAEGAAALYPESIVEYMVDDHPRLNKVYTLTTHDDPAQIPTADFEREGRIYTLLDMTRQDNTQVEVKEYTETVTVASKNKDKEKIVSELAASMEVTTEDGYTGTLELDTASIQVEAAGYGTSSKTVTATRSYPNLSDADVSFVPKTIEDNGHTLTLDDVQWQEAGGFYHATATYSGTVTSRYVTGYTVTVAYTGEVSKAINDTVTYTAIFGAAQIQQEEEPLVELPVPEIGAKWLWVIPIGLCVVGVIALVVYLSKKHKTKKSWEGYTR